MQSSIGDLVGAGRGLVRRASCVAVAGGQALISVFALLVVTPVVAFYLLVDWDRMVATVDALAAAAPPRHRAQARARDRRGDRRLRARPGAGLPHPRHLLRRRRSSLIGLNFGALIGMIAGLLSFIPYVGSLTGLVLSVGVALVQFWPDWTWILATLGVFVVGQFLEGNILSPKLVGDSVGLHPVWLMFALFAFGSLFGFVGLLLAVPLAAAVGVLVRFALAALSRKPALSRRRRDGAARRPRHRPAGSRWLSAPKQLALDLPLDAALRPRGFPRQPLERARLRA